MGIPPPPREEKYFTRIFKRRDLYIYT